MIIVYSDDAKAGLGAVKGIRDSGGRARYLAAAEFTRKADMESGVEEVWLLDGPHEAIEAAYGKKKVVAKYKEQPAPRSAPKSEAPPKAESEKSDKPEAAPDAEQTQKGGIGRGRKTSG